MLNVVSTVGESHAEEGTTAWSEPDFIRSHSQVHNSPGALASSRGLEEDYWTRHSPYSSSSNLTGPPNINGPHGPQNSSGPYQHSHSLPPHSQTQSQVPGSPVTSHYDPYSYPPPGPSHGHGHGQGVSGGGHISHSHSLSHHPQHSTHHLQHSPYMAQQQIMSPHTHPHTLSPILDPSLQTSAPPSHPYAPHSSVALHPSPWIPLAPLVSSNPQFSHTLPALGQTRCYWSILSAFPVNPPAPPPKKRGRKPKNLPDEWKDVKWDVRFGMVDPVFANHLEGEKELLVDRELWSLMMEDDQERVRKEVEDYLNQTYQDRVSPPFHPSSPIPQHAVTNVIKQEDENLPNSSQPVDASLGIVVRCRFPRLPRIRAILAGQSLDDERNDGIYPQDPEAHMYLVNEHYVQVDMMISWVADGSLVAFLHICKDKSAVADNDPKNVSHWSNYCGPLVASPSVHYFSPTFLGELTSLLKSNSLTSLDKAPLHEEDKKKGKTPGFIFLILDAESGALIANFPPAGATVKSAYKPEIYAKRARRCLMQEFSSWEYGEGGGVRGGREAEEREIRDNNQWTVGEGTGRSGERKSNCAKRKFVNEVVLHPAKPNTTYSIQYTVLRYAAIAFATFETGGITLTEEPTPVAFPVSQQQPIQGNVHQVGMEDIDPSLTNPQNSHSGGVQQQIQNQNPMQGQQGQEQFFMGNSHPSIPNLIQSSNPNNDFDQEVDEFMKYTERGNASQSASGAVAAAGGTMKRGREEFEEEFEGSKRAKIEEDERERFHATTVPSMNKFGLVPNQNSPSSEGGRFRHPNGEDGSFNRVPPVDIEAARSWAPPPAPGTPSAGGYLPEALSPTIATASAILGSFSNPGGFDHAYRGYDEWQGSGGGGSPYGTYPTGLHALASVTGRGRSVSLTLPNGAMVPGSPGGNGNPNVATVNGTSTTASGMTSTAAIQRRRQNAKQTRSCSSCGATDSPEWRKGPSGDKTLCNACGLRFARAQARTKKKADQAAGLLPKEAKGRRGKKSKNQTSHQPQETLQPPVEVDPPSPSNNTYSTSKSPYINSYDYPSGTPPPGYGGYLGGAGEQSRHPSWGYAES